VLVRRRWWVGVLLALCTALGVRDRAAAHLGDLSYSDVVVHGATIDYKLRFATHLIPGFGEDVVGKITRRDVVAREAEITAWLRDTLIIRLAGAHCAPALVDSIGPDQNDDLTVVLRYTCPAAGAELRIEFHAFDEALPEFQNIAAIQHDGRTTAFVFTAVSPLLVTGATAEAGAAAQSEADTSFRRFFVLGVEHIWTGYDHLAFLLALLLPGGTLARLAGIVTAFTIAHSITLGLAALGILTLPVRPVEAAIAASVIVAALDGLRPHAHDRRWLLTFAFGLIHGFGFAGVLREVGLPSEAVALPLLAFNLGVEAGQLVIVVLTVPLIRAIAGSRHGPALLRTIALAIAALGAFWLTSRL
jgi:hydrogenase/urease accessory protein HupE